ncbi:hypothetical protein CONCODRAFT_72354 [Conidiobolus coronatus NRRL 28638]|uniref:Uncharacterized protein n=1 Tax=Conidiobolus coronatus (strain ATCC 28846 / CBS 209.66 / NRRL 28638) TaxID=796925 RepID=A0A137P009_CONC2|nr:hypothetical protein CONCODRAFT_72354 [Conidiobolus coronatus NRRL 28638]|eukprot:KXN68288.1 hypothetical protein CONCODRAFT_72354 [Conidiobolus coronatus NRRL 28638]
MEEWLAETTRSLKKHFPEHISQPSSHRKSVSQDYKSWFMLSKKSTSSTPMESYKSTAPNPITRSRKSINSKNYHLPPTFSTIEQPNSATTTPISTNSQVNPHCKLKRSYHKLKKVTPAESATSESAPCYSFMVEYESGPNSRSRSRSMGMHRNTSFSEDIKLYEKSHLYTTDVGGKADFIQNFDQEITVQQVMGAPILTPTSAYNCEDNHKSFKRYTDKESGDDSFYNFIEEEHVAELDIDRCKQGLKSTPSFHRALSFSVENIKLKNSQNSFDEQTSSPKSPNRHTMPALRSMSELGEIIGQAHKHQKTKSPPVQTNVAMRTIVINPPITCPLFQPVQVNNWESNSTQL